MFFHCSHSSPILDRFLAHPSPRMLSFPYRALPRPSIMKGVDFIKDIHETGDIGPCPYVGHTGCMIITWEDNTVISVDCAGGDHETCGYADRCELYQRHPVGFVQTYPLKKD